jgi:predicted nucleic acid-binding protein
MPTIVAVVDANVLYSIEVTDLILTIATKRIVRLHWSDEILDEVRRNLAKRPALSPSAIEYRIDQMNRALPGALDNAPTTLVETMPVNDKDRHVLALAVHVEASVIVTNNLRDFPQAACAPFGVEAVSADMFIDRQLEANPDDVLEALNDIAERRRRPPRTVASILDRLEAALPTSVASCRLLPQVADHH